MKLNRPWAKVVFRSAKETDERVHVPNVHASIPKGHRYNHAATKGHAYSIIRFVRGEAVIFCQSDLA